MLPADLASHWHALTAPLLPDYARREAERARLFAAYEAPGRHYHTRQHLSNVFDILARFPQQDAPVLALAVWYHDAVYSALCADNEEKSADWALEFLGGTTLAPARQARVADLIRRTKDHTQPQPPGDPDLLLFLDADLSILGAPEVGLLAVRPPRAPGVSPGARPALPPRPPQGAGQNAGSAGALSYSHATRRAGRHRSAQLAGRAHGLGKRRVA